MINNIVKKIFSSSKVPPSISIMYSILSKWEEISEDFFYKHSVPYKFFVKKSELYIACDDPTIATEVYFNQNELKRRIKEKTKISVKTIKSTYNLQKFYKFKKVLDETKKERKNKELKIKSSQKEKIKKILTRVKDPKLKESLQTFFESVSVIQEIRKSINH